ncbi:MAG: ABC transporter permease [Acidobacteria bacterium]|nr:ABC transporter permease [Acidobacteriota bacterium]MCA1650841.1 ABC transporter permease [Acidobacteriota bacterium]
MNWLSQIIAVTGVTLRSIPQRLGSATVAVIGIAGVVIVFTAVLSIAEGFRAAMRGTGDPQTVIVLRAGSDTEMTSGFSGDDVKLISEAPGIERGPTGPHASPELFVIVGHPLKRSGTDANVPLRGVSAAALQVRPGLKIVEGRMFQPGTNEIIVGRAASQQFAGLSVGTSARWGEGSWQVVGIFDAGGSIAESEIWSDAKVLQPAYRRGNSYQSVYLRLESPDSLQQLKDALTIDPRLNVTVIREPDYYEQQSRVLQSIIRTIGFAIAALMGLGAVFGAVNTMYSAVASRTREIATLRALGFGRSPVVISVLVESLVLSLVGGAIGGLLAWAAFDGYQTATMNWQSFSQVAFAFAVTPALLTRGLIYASIMGLVGGLLPAIRAARLPVVTALREL